MFFVFVILFKNILNSTSNNLLQFSKYFSNYQQSEKLFEYLADLPYFEFLISARASQKMRAHYRRESLCK
jgi:hypothetical protein